jgi:outer membrane murein-binding lipoprotein Lpp
MKNENTIVSALNVAADQYDRDAAAIRAEIKKFPPMGATHDGLAEHFDRQAAEARELASKIEQHGLDQAAYL